MQRKFQFSPLDGVTEQDLKLAGRIIEEGRAVVLVVKKWDAVEKDTYSKEEAFRQYCSY